MNPPIVVNDWTDPCLSPLTDPQLLQACRAGDEESWQQLLDKYGRLVYAIPLHYRLPSEEAATITQIVFTALLQSLDSWCDESNLDRWLLLVTRRHTWRTLHCHPQCTDGAVNAAPLPFFPAAHPGGERAPAALPSAVYGALRQRFANYVQYRQQCDLFHRQQGTLTYDSLYQPSPVGVRTGKQEATRHFVYTNDRLDITLSSQPCRQGSRRNLIGQLLPNGADLTAKLFAVQLVQGGEEVAITLPDCVGSFWFERLKPGNYELVFSTNSLEIELPNFALTD